MISVSVSVVVPVYNSQETIGLCLESLLAQDCLGGGYEIIVVDNNSNDGSDEIIRQFPVKLLYEREIQTSYAARNSGIRAANGEIIAFTDADCIAASSWLQELIYPFKDPVVGGVGGQVLDYSPRNDVETFLGKLQLFSKYQEEDSFLPILLAGSTAYRLEHLLALNGFNASLYTGADIDLAWRLQLELNARVKYAPDAIVYHVHRTTLKGMGRQFRRHGFGEILLDAMYHNRSGYRRTPRRQMIRMVRQFLALFIYLRSLVYRRLVVIFRNKDRMYIRTPLYWFIVESNNLQGKLMGLWATRFFRLNPAERLWEDPGER